MDERQIAIDRLMAYRSPDARQEYRKKHYRTMPNEHLALIALVPGTNRTRKEFKYRLAVEEYERRLKLGIIGGILETASKATFETKIEHF